MKRRKRFIVWSLCLLAVIGISIYFATALISEQRQGILKPAHISELVGLWFVLITLSVLGTLIISQQPQNRIGWLLILPALARVIPLESLLPA